MDNAGGKRAVTDFAAVSPLKIRRDFVSAPSPLSAKSRALPLLFARKHTRDAPFFRRSLRHCTWKIDMDIVGDNQRLKRKMALLIFYNNL